MSQHGNKMWSFTFTTFTRVCFFRFWVGVQECLHEDRIRQKLVLIPITIERVFICKNPSRWNKYSYNYYAELVCKTKIEWCVLKHLQGRSNSKYNIGNSCSDIYIWWLYYSWRIVLYQSSILATQASRDGLNLSKIQNEAARTSFYC